MGSIKPGETVAVFGCGPVGLFAQVSAWLQGAGRVIGVDQYPYRLEFARRYSGAETVNFREVDDIVATLKEMTDGRGPDVCIDAVGLEADGSVLHEFVGRVAMLQPGNPIAIAQCINAVRKGGNVVIIGVYGPPWNWVPIGTAMNKGLTCKRSSSPRRPRHPGAVLGEVLGGAAADPSRGAGDDDDLFRQRSRHRAVVTILRPRAMPRVSSPSTSPNMTCPTIIVACRPGRSRSGGGMICNAGRSPAYEAIHTPRA